MDVRLHNAREQYILIDLMPSYIKHAPGYTDAAADVSHDGVHAAATAAARNAARCASSHSQIYIVVPPRQQRQHIVCAAVTHTMLSLIEIYGVRLMLIWPCAPHYIVYIEYMARTQQNTHLFRRGGERRIASNACACGGLNSNAHYTVFSLRPGVAEVE